MHLIFLSIFCHFILSSTSLDFSAQHLVADKDLDHSPSGLRKYWERRNKPSQAWIVLQPCGRLWVIVRLSGDWSLGMWSMLPLLFSEAPLFIYGLSSKSPTICTESASDREALFLLVQNPTGIIFTCRHQWRQISPLNESFPLIELVWRMKTTFQPNLPSPVTRTGF